MSFLNDKIQEVIGSAGKTSNISGMLHDFKAEIEERLVTLYSTDDLRIFDGENGGALRGPITSRKNYEIKENNEVTLCCDSGNIQSKITEPVYSRAIFNSGRLGVYQLIAYETPLMRKRTNSINPEISGRQVSCDLLGISKGEICCIEVKINPFDKSCRPTYALLEGLAYCICLNWILKINPLDLSREIDLCCKSFGIKASNLPEKATFAIAAPMDDYFLPYWRMEDNTEEWFQRRKNEIQVIENAIFSEFEQYFSGYIAIATSTSMIRAEIADHKSDCVIPRVINKDSIVRQPFVKIFKSFFDEY